jgi:hypothetical protein
LPRRRVTGLRDGAVEAGERAPEGQRERGGGGGAPPREGGERVVAARTDASVGASSWRRAGRLGDGAVAVGRRALGEEREDAPAPAAATAKHWVLATRRTICEKVLSVICYRLNTPQLDRDYSNFG